MQILEMNRSNFTLIFDVATYTALIGALSLFLSLFASGIGFTFFILFFCELRGQALVLFLESFQFVSLGFGQTLTCWRFLRSTGALIL
jgi:hypothetical protein